MRTRVIGRSIEYFHYFQVFSGDTRAGSLWIESVCLARSASAGRVLLRQIRVELAQVRSAPNAFLMAGRVAALLSRAMVRMAAKRVSVSRPRRGETKP